MRLTSASFHSLQRAKRQQHRSLAQPEPQSNIDVLSLSIVVIAHLAVITFFLVNFGPEPLPTKNKTQVLQVSLTQATPSKAINSTTTAERVTTNLSAVIPLDSPSNGSSHSSEIPHSPAPLIELPHQELPVLRNYETHYFTRAELTEKAQVIDDVANEIALDIPTTEAQKLVLLLFINEEGGIDKVVLQQAHLPEEAAQIVQANFMRLRFSPGKIDGVAVKSQLSIEVHLEGNSLPPLQLGGAK